MYKYIKENKYKQIQTICIVPLVSVKRKGRINHSNFEIEEPMTVYCINK